MTRADGYWAAKIIMAFKDEDIRAIIKTGKLSEAADEENIFTLLKERRDAIGRYWFSQASPAENFKLGGGKFSFSDLEAERGFQESSSGWTLEGFAAEEKKGRKLGKLESSTPSFGIPDEWLKSRNLTLLLRVHRASEKKPRPCVFLEIKDGKMTKALHQD